MKVVSFITEHNRCSKNLEKSLQKYNYDYIFIGLGKKWINFIDKIKGYLDYILVTDYDYYILIDGYDMLACRGDLNYKGDNIICGGEKFCFSYNGVPINKYGSISMFEKRKYLNSGFCLGRRDRLIDLYSWVIKTSNQTKIYDDQKLICMYANKYNTIDVDLDSKLVFNTITTIDKNNFAIKNNKLLILSTQTNPYFIHFPSIQSDGYERYNNFGSLIIERFNRCYGRSSWNIFANLKLYSFISVILIGILIKLFRKKFGYIFLFICYWLSKYIKF